MKISVVIPNYNGADLLKKNLPKVLETIKGKSIEIIIVDDCSTDDSVETLRNMGIKFIINTKNLGFSSSVNKGVKISKGEIIVLLNTDVYPEKNFLTPLVENFKDKNVFAVGFLDKSIENGKTILRGRGIGKWQKGFLVHAKGSIDKTNTLWASGGSAAFRKSIWERLGGFDELYNPFYWEDIDLSYRALKSGFKVLFEPKSVVFHEHKKGAIKTNYSDFKIKTTSYRNQFIFAWKNGTDFNIELSQLLFLPYHMFLSLLRRDWAFILGFFKALSILPKIMKSSLDAQKSFIISDRKVTKEFME